MLINWAPYRESGSISNPLRIRFSDFRSSREVRPCESHSVFGKTSSVQQPVQLCLFAFNTAPMEGPLAEFSPVSLQLVSHTPQEPLWDQLVRQYHYLGCRKLLGHRLKYIAFSGGRPVAALSWSAAALKTGAGEAASVGLSRCFQRKERLGRDRRRSAAFSLRPGCASRIRPPMCLALSNRAVCRGDWRTQFSTDVLLLETFVDRSVSRPPADKARQLAARGDAPTAAPKTELAFAIMGNQRRSILCVRVGSAKN